MCALTWRSAGDATMFKINKCNDCRSISKWWYELSWHSAQLMLQEPSKIRYLSIAVRNQRIRVYLHLERSFHTLHEARNSHSDNALNKLKRQLRIQKISLFIHLFLSHTSLLKAWEKKKSLFIPEGSLLLNVRTPQPVVHFHALHKNWVLLPRVGLPSVSWHLDVRQQDHHHKLHAAVQSDGSGEAEEHHQELLEDGAEPCCAWRDLGALTVVENWREMDGLQSFRLSPSKMNRSINNAGRIITLKAEHKRYLTFPEVN